MTVKRTKNYLDSMDTFTKGHTQANAHINSLLCDDNIKYLNDEDVSAILWAVSERLEEMKTAFKVLTK